MADPTGRPLGQQMLRGVALFQLLLSLPIMLMLGIFAFDQLFYAYGRYYYFLAGSITSLMSAGITFIVYVQRKAVITVFQTLLFEGVKATLATGLWIWLILDCAFGPWRKDIYRTPGDVERRVARAALAILLLLFFFYPPCGYAYYVWKNESRQNDENTVGDDVAEEFGATERTPLLSHGG